MEQFDPANSRIQYATEWNKGIDSLMGRETCILLLSLIRNCLWTSLLAVLGSSRKLSRPNYKIIIVLKGSKSSCAVHTQTILTKNWYSMKRLLLTTNITINQMTHMYLKQSPLPLSHTREILNWSNCDFSKVM